MRLQVGKALTAALSLAALSDALRILMGNDDGFGSGNLRQLYGLLKDAGHEGIGIDVLRRRKLMLILSQC